MPAISSPPERTQISSPDTQVLGSYITHEGCRREVVTRPAAHGTRLVIDRDRDDPGQGRLIAHLAADEPEHNAQLMCRHYLSDPRGRFCRAVTSEDLVGAALPGPVVRAHASAPLTDRDGNAYSLTQVAGACREIPELRWVRERPAYLLGEPEAVSLRCVIGALESYEPARSLTAAAVSAHRQDRGVSVVVLAAELARSEASPITLNRLLRDAVRAGLATGLTMSVIAMRCGRVKRDPRGNVSGETSWLGRRLGMLPEAGGHRPTPWIHSDVLGVIARRGLGISPREVELG